MKHQSSDHRSDQAYQQDRLQSHEIAQPARDHGENPTQAEHDGSQIAGVEGNPAEVGIDVYGKQRPKGGGEKSGEERDDAEDDKGPSSQSRRPAA